MLAFITTLRHPQNSADYGRVESLLQDTLASISRQTSDEYVVIIVGNRRPAFGLPERAHFVEVDFAPPSAVKGPQTGRASVIWDKGTKTAVGLIAAREYEPDYVMPFDADDFVHRDIAGFTDSHRGGLGWVVTRGWVYSRARNAYALRRKFFRICGTSFIVPFDAYEVPTDLTVSATQQEIAAAFGERLENLLEHGYAFDWWREHGRRLDPLPFAGAVYQVDTGENHSGNMLVGPALPYASHLLRDFGIRPSKGRAATVWAAFGAPAFKPDPAYKLQLPSLPGAKRRVSYLENYSPPTDSAIGSP
ncbi:hypothetical protein A5724_32315 [Mycobacterium sp. ACS1612]|uniref:hypothetical protein n=1 Tax=Mycobacterium sp. ACS1612 TaxID=1834117 RepID=UPI0007FEB9D5|nr:hypothetical protein [Mycobacterium sp. ACS1612]OBF25995.1 hypothetical protein A5724_32315 [Mycobacterium sp. ACS1612]